MKEYTVMNKKNKSQVDSQSEETPNKDLHDQIQENVDNLNDHDDSENLDRDDNGDQLLDLQKEIEAGKDRYLRTFAEFENYKRRTEREKIELYKTAGADVLKSLLPVLDDFERALKEIEKSGDQDLAKGVMLINNKLQETLRSKGLEIMDIRPGDDFNADRHEAVTQIPAPEKKLKGKIVDVIENGYTLGDRIIRYPKVIIGQ